MKFSIFTLCSYVFPENMKRVFLLIFLLVLIVLVYLNWGDSVSDLKSNFNNNRESFEGLKSDISDSSFEFSWIYLKEKGIEVMNSDTSFVVMENSTKEVDKIAIDIYKLMKELNLCSVSNGSKYIEMTPSGFLPSNHCAMLVYVKKGIWESPYNTDFKTIEVDKDWYVQQMPCSN